MPIVDEPAHKWARKLWPNVGRRSGLVGRRMGPVTRPTPSRRSSSLNLAGPVVAASSADGLSWTFQPFQRRSTSGWSFMTLIGGQALAAKRK